MEDSLVIQEIIADALVPEGYDVSLAQSRAAALDVIRAELPDLIILARVLPDSYGVDLLRLLRQDSWTREIPVVFVTSLNREKYVAEACEAGATDYMLKPFSAVFVRSKVAQVLGAYLAGQTSRR